MNVTAAILAGGASRRMGTDKAGLVWRGRTLLARVADAATAAGLPVVVVGRSEPAGWDVAGCGFAPDDEPGLGPLGGLVSALRATTGPVLLLSCDMPLLTEDAVRWLADAASAMALDRGLVTVTDRPQQLFAVYTQAVLPLAEARAAGDDRSLRGLIAQGGFAEIAAPDWVCVQLRSANTPEEWADLAARSGEIT